MTEPPPPANGEGWCPDPLHPRRYRWFDGTEWTDAVLDRPPMAKTFGEQIVGDSAGPQLDRDSPVRESLLALESTTSPDPEEEARDAETSETPGPVAMSSGGTRHERFYPASLDEAWLALRQAIFYRTEFHVDSEDDSSKVLCFSTTSTTTGYGESAIAEAVLQEGGCMVAVYPEVESTATLSSDHWSAQASNVVLDQVSANIQSNRRRVTDPPYPENSEQHGRGYPVRGNTQMTASTSGGQVDDSPTSTRQRRGAELTGPKVLIIASAAGAALLFVIVVAVVAGGTHTNNTQTNNTPSYRAGYESGLIFSDLAYQYAGGPTVPSNPDFLTDCYPSPHELIYSGIRYSGGVISTADVNQDDYHQGCEDGYQHGIGK